MKRTSSKWKSTKTSTLASTPDNSDLVAPVDLFLKMTTPKLEQYRAALTLDRAESSNDRLYVFATNRIDAINRILEQRSNTERTAQETE